MPRQLTVYRCLVISPGDVAREREAIGSVIDLWNAHAGRGLNARLEAVRWESHARPEMTGPPQDVINKQLVDDCDFGIAVFWYRLGTPTASHPSGSAEEVERLLQRGADVMVYFSTAPVPQDALKDDQFTRLRELRSTYEQRGLLATYQTIEQFRELVSLHLNSLVSKRLLQDRAQGQPIPSTGTITAPTPDIRVHVASAYVARGSITSVVLAITVANHSPVTFYFASMTFVMEDLTGAFVQRDAATGDFQLPKQIEPGNAYSFHVDPADLREAVRGHGPPISVAVKDKIGRVFSPVSGLTRAAFNQAVQMASEIPRAR